MTTALEIRFLTGRFHATPWGSHVNEGAIEWPPAPWRLFRALVAAGARTTGMATGELRGILRPFLDAPSYHLPLASAAHARYWMPWEKKGPADRTKILDAFVILSPSSPVTIVWPRDSLEADRLDAMLEGLGYLGRSQSWVEMRRVQNHQDPDVFPLAEGQEAPGDWETVRLLAPDPRAPDEALRGALLGTSELHGQGLAVPPGTRWIRYARPPLDIEPVPKQRARLAGRARPTMARYLLEGPALPPLTEAITMCDLLRRSVMAQFGRRAEGGASPVLSGKDERGRPLSGHRHAFYLATDEDDDRRIDRLTVVAADGFGPGERDALRSVRVINPGRGRPEVRLFLLGVGDVADFPAPLAMSSRCWRSHTPFVLIRHPKVRGTFEAGKRVVDAPEDQVRLELTRRGLPAPAAVRRLRSARWLEFRRHRRGSESLGWACGFELEFDEPVRGPIAIGYGCHFGLGLFVADISRSGSP